MTRRLGFQAARRLSAAARITGAAGVCLALAACSAQTRQTASAPQAEPAPPQAVDAAPVSLNSSVPLPPIAPPFGSAAQAKPVAAVAIASTTVAPAPKIGKSGGGLASWYGDRFHGRRTANGERFNMGAFTAAHPSFPLPSYVRVTNVSNGRSMVVRVNDRGPFHGGRVIDVSKRAADVLGFRGHGVGTVKLDYIGKAPSASDDSRLLASYQEFGRPALAPGMQMAALAPVSDADLAAESGFGGTAYAVASRAVTRSADYVMASAASAASTVKSAAVATTDTAKAAIRRVIPAAPATPAEAPAAAVPAYAPPQPLLASVPAAIATGETGPSKRVITPTEPALASATPPLRPSLPSGPDVSSRIASSFDIFGPSSGASAPVR